MELATGQGKDIFDWLRYKTYSQPTWVAEARNKHRFGTFDDYWVVQVRTRYIDLENEFVINILPLIKEGLSEADRIQYSHTSFLLFQAREELQKDKPELIMATVLLDQVERYVVWGYEIDALDAKIDTFYAQLQSTKLPEKNKIVERVEKCRTSYKKIQETIRLAEEKSPDQIQEIKHRWKDALDDAEYDLEAVMDESINVMNRANLQEFINDQLQNNRLSSLIAGGGILIFLLILLSPLAINSRQITGWPSQDMNFLPIAATYFNSLVIAIMGAGGAFLSGLLQVRSSHITFSAYHESIKKLALRPIVGAIIAMVLFVLLSWGVVPGFTVSNAGSYIFLVFVAGFSERFFLRIIQTESEIGSVDQSGVGQPAGSASGLVSSPTNPAITNPTITNPTITNPTIANPTITNPTIANPTITNPAITNPAITNPTIANPAITNPTITNPAITNSTITSIAPTNPTETKV